ncbi:site-specific integrase [Streptomyces sp. NL15-2K]|uniref:tyrosine-type recombinase/integrase n=1 Tax=Streptomyces sp. NL15-2K TaxID=376149 RepID=UPI000FF9C5B1|nr:MULTISPECIES: site-specific integrase [Actinomycetes]WKX06087.1 site-specific integrase [Kutzneria buriramensis]GCB52742.1 mobile element protein [Streptomyces sp. NL15-2K]
MHEVGQLRDVTMLAVPKVGRVQETGSVSLPYRLLDRDGGEVAAVSEFLLDMLANDDSPASLRSYAYELLAWFRFLWAVEVPWDRASRVEARDFALWLQTVKKPPRPRRPDAPPPGSINPVTGKRYPGEHYAARTRRHARAVVRSFYEYHRETHGRPLLNPFPRARRAEDEHLNAHHNPMHRFRQPARRAPYQPKEPRRAPRGIPDQAFNELFAALPSHRDRALVAFYISAGPRASELLGVTRDRVSPGDQTIGVVRKGSRALQWIPASSDAFVWLRLYQQQIRPLALDGPDEPLRRPLRPPSYDAARMVFTRTNEKLGANWTLHDLRHSAAKRMVRDPALSITDVQWVLGHLHVATTEQYLEPVQDEVVAQILAHHARQAAEPPWPVMPAPGYRSEVLQTLLGTAVPSGGPA